MEKNYVINDNKTLANKIKSERHEKNNNNSNIT